MKEIPLRWLTKTSKMLLTQKIFTFIFLRMSHFKTKLLSEQLPNSLNTKSINCARSYLRKPGDNLNSCYEDFKTDETSEGEYLTNETVYSQ